MALSLASHKRSESMDVESSSSNSEKVKSTYIHCHVTKQTMETQKFAYPRFCMHIFWPRMLGDDGCKDFKKRTASILELLQLQTVRETFTWTAVPSSHLQFNQRFARGIHSHANTSSPSAAPFWMFFLRSSRTTPCPCRRWRRPVERDRSNEGNNLFWFWKESF